MSALLTKLNEVGLSNALELSGVQEGMLLSLTQEIAMDIVDVPDIVAAHGLTMDAFKKLAETARFRDLLREQTIKWNSAKSAPERIKAKSESMVEAALPELFKELVKPGLSPAKVELVKTLTRMGGVSGAEKAEGAGAEKVFITINMGAEKSVEFKGAVIDHNAEDV